MSSSYSANKAVRSESVRGAVGRQPRPTCDVVLGASRRTAIADTGKVGRATALAEEEEEVCAMIASQRGADEAATPTTEADDEEVFPLARPPSRAGAVDATGAERRGTLLIGTTARSQLGTLRFGAMNNWSAVPKGDRQGRAPCSTSGANKLEVNG